MKKIDDTEILIGDKMTDDIALKDVVILLTYVIKYSNKLYTEIFLEEAIISKDLWGVVIVVPKLVKIGGM